MSTTTTPPAALSAGLLDTVVDAQAAARAADLARLQATLAWAAAHTEHSLTPPVEQWHEQALPLAGQGAPQVAEYALVEYAAALGMTFESARRYLGNALELRHRLPLLYARVAAGELEVWRAFRITDVTRTHSPATAAHVDTACASVAHKIGPVLIERHLEHALAACEPDVLEDQRLQAAETRHATVHKNTPLQGGTVEFTADLDAPDALDLDTALAEIAAALLQDGSEDSLDVRRALALGMLARGEHPSTHTEESGTDGPADNTESSDSRRRRREIILHIHLTDQAVAGTGTGKAPLVTVEGWDRPITAETLLEWCRAAGATLTVKPVIDLNTDLTSTGYQPNTRLAEQVRLRDQRCRFPHCNRPARTSDLDHIQPFDTGGPTTSANLACLCRRHHRVKTTGGWTYHQERPGVYIWTSPQHRRYLVDPHGTTSLGTATQPADENNTQAA